MMKTICEAIKRRALLEFEYEGLQRVVQPYCHGDSTKNKESLRAIQIRGESSRGSDGMYFGKLWTVASMSRVRILDESFIPNDPKYNPNDKDMVAIHCRI